MFIRRDFEADAAAGSHVVHRGIPMADFGSAVCTLNGMPVSYQEIYSVFVTEPSFGRKKLELVMRKGGRLAFEGPAFGPGVKTFLKQANAMVGQVKNHAASRWLDVMESRLRKDEAFQIDDFRYQKSGECFNGEMYLTSLQDPVFSVGIDTDGWMRISHPPRSPDAPETFTRFNLGIAGASVAKVLDDERRAFQAQAKKPERNGFEERAVLALIALASVAGGWLPDTLPSRLRKFCAKRGIDLNKTKVDLSHLDYATLAIDKRFVRNTFNTIADYCRTRGASQQLRFNDLVEDLIEVAADGNRISSVAVYFIYEIALFQGRTMHYVPTAITRVIGGPYEEVVDAQWGKTGYKTGPQRQEERARAQAEWNTQAEKTQAGWGSNSRRQRPEFEEPTKKHASEPKPKAPTSPKKWVFSVMTIEHYRFFGFENPPKKKELKKVYRNLLKKHHPDHIQMTGSPMELEEANQMVKEINNRFSWLESDLKEFWSSPDGNDLEEKRSA